MTRSEAPSPAGTARRVRSKPSTRNAGSFLHARDGHVDEELPAPRDPRAAEDDEVRAEVGEALERQEVRPVARRDGAAVREAVVAGAGPRREAQRENRVEAERDRAPHVVVEVAVPEEVPRVAVVRREREALGVRGRHEREEVVEVLRGRALADPDVHPEADLLVRLGAREALVVRADAGADVRVQVEAGEERRVPVDRNAPAARVLHLRDDAGVAEEETRDVHHLGEPEHLRQVVERREVLRRERGARRLEVRRRDARREHDEDVHGKRRRRREEVANPRHAPHVRDLVRVRHGRRSPVSGGEARERAGRRHRGLDVEVRVPERGGDVRAAKVQGVLRARGPVVAEAEDAVPFHADGPLVDLARQDVHDPGVPQDEIGGDRPAGGRHEVGERERSRRIAHAADSVRQTGRPPR